MTSTSATERPPATGSVDFRAAVARLLVPGMGTETVAPLLSSLVQLLRPRRVLEVGMGYTTPWLAATLVEIEQQVIAEADALAAKSRSHLSQADDLDEKWLYDDPALLAPAFYLEPYRTDLVAIDNLSIADSSAARVQEVLGELRLADRVTIVNADLRDSIDLLPDGFAPIDLAWVDAWECLWFFDHFWDLVNPDGGVVVMHYLMTYPEGEAILKYLTSIQRSHPGEMEVVNFLEPHKLVQNSLTVLRRTATKSPSYARPGGKLTFDTFRADAEAQTIALNTSSRVVRER